MKKMLLRGGTVYDGTGQKGFRGDVAVDGDLIVGVGKNLDDAGGIVIDATGLVVTPGFIDIHTHSDRTIFDTPSGASKVMQGVTTEVTGHCGLGSFPVSAGRKMELEQFLATEDGYLPPDGLSWHDFAGFAAKVDSLPLGINVAPLVGHCALRIAAMGSEYRAPTGAELAVMRDMLDNSLRQGAWGLSSGLIYPPSSFAATDELVAIGRVLADRKALYSSHIRSEGVKLMESIEEAIKIGRDSGVRVLVSHLKALGQPFWGNGQLALARITAAREAGVDIWADQYPYEAGSTGLSVLIPGWAHDGGVAKLLERLADETLKGRILEDINREMGLRGGPERVKLVSIKSQKNGRFVGKTVKNLAESWGLKAEEAVHQLVLEEAGAVGAIYFSIGADDMAAILKNPDVAVGSDGSVMSPETDGHKSVHPRNYGTFPRVLGLYVRDKGLLAMETAIRKMTSLPAHILRLPDRGAVRTGFKADLTVFDPLAVRDRADFDNPHQYATGIQHVLVNGTMAVRDGRLTGEGKGLVLRKA